jgi:hypothetical protein
MSFLRGGAATTHTALYEIADVCASTAKTDSPCPQVRRAQSMDYGAVIPHGANHARATVPASLGARLSFSVDRQFEPGVPGDESR